MAQDSKKPAGLFEGREEFLQVFRRGADFFEQLLSENERLRFRNAAVEEELRRLRARPGGDDSVESLEQQVRRLTDERERLLQKFQEVESANANFAARYAEIEEEHNLLANLYIASYQLHSTLSFPEVVRIILEIAINLIGISRLVLYLHDVDRQLLVPIAGDGVGETFDLEGRGNIRVGEGVVGTAVARAERYVAEPPPAEGTDPLAVIPLVAGAQTVGALVLERFLVQKERWSQVDFELFTLLSAHAGTALLATALRSNAQENPMQVDALRKLLTEAS